VAFSETCCKGYEVRDGHWSYRPWAGGILSATSSRYKLITDPLGVPTELYDLVRDPAELHDLLGGDLSADAAAAVAELRATVVGRLERLSMLPPEEVDGPADATLERLRELGYVQ
jgi:hypothetical protein